MKTLKPGDKSESVKTESPKPEEPKAEKPAKAKFVVATEFRDINDFTRVYKVGMDVSYMGKDRLEHLVNTGIVEKK